MAAAGGKSAGSTHMIGEDQCPERIQDAAEVPRALTFREIWLARPSGCLVVKLQPQDVIHRIASGRLSHEKLGGGEGSVSVAVPRVASDGQVDRVSHHAEDDRVLADVVARPQSVIANLVARPLTRTA